MYLNYFGLAEAPFSIAPAPRFLHMSPRHQEALAHLLYGVGGDGGFVLLTGEVGTGKTTVCRCLLEQIPESCDVAYIFNPKMTVAELLSTLCTEFGIDCPPDNTSIKVFVDHINAHLLDAHARGRHAVLIIDEAQNLSPEVLEQMRLLTNLETSERKLLQIILIGQPELAEMLARPELRQLAQRIVARYHLEPLSREEVAAYVRHRLEVAGTQKPLIPASLMGRLHRLSGGIPRLLNVLCDRALLGAYAKGKKRGDRPPLAQAAREFLPRPARSTLPRWAVAAAFLLLLGGGWLLMEQPWREAPASAPAPRSAQPAAASTAQIPSPAGPSWPSGEAAATSSATAYASLFRAWGLTYGPGKDPCRQADAAGLRCRTSEQGSLDELRQINRPAVLVLRNEAGGEFHALLTGLTATSASFQFNREIRTVSLDALTERWTGRYTLFWRRPAQVRDTLRPGNHGEAVAWLRQALDRRDGAKPAAHPDPFFDDTLRQRVSRYQSSRGLVPDGSAGEQTLIRLLGEIDTSAPTLLASRRPENGATHPGQGQ